MAKMNHTLEELTSSYSLFKENQVLTASQLNEIVKYFDDQDRLTRTLGIGVGLICGMELNFDQEQGEIKISKGCGITTDGDLLFWQNPHALTKYRAFNDEEAEYTYFTSESGKMQLWELLPDDSEQAGLKAIKSWSEKDDTDAEIALEDLAVIAYLENYQKEPDTCTELDCDNQGIQVLRNLKFLLIEKGNLNLIIENFDTIFKKYKKVNNAQNQLPRIRIERVVLNSINTSSEASLFAAYAKAINRLRVPFINALESLYLNYSGLLDPQNAISFSSWNVRLTSSLNLGLVQTFKFFQYRYDWAKDLVHAYTLLRESLYRLEKECCPNPAAFPKHLMISELIREEQIPEFRHGFYPSPAVSGENENLLIAKFLFKKLNSLILNFQAPVASELKVTPSGLHHGAPAIPFYYNASKVYENWNWQLSKAGRDDENLSYSASAYAQEGDDAILKPLNYDIDQYDFFRIEGHIGKDYAQAIKEIKTKISSNGLPIEVVALRLGSLAEKLNLDDYKCYFDDLEVVLRAWEVELNCLMKTLSRFFSGFKLDLAGAHYDYSAKTESASARESTSKDAGNLAIGDIIYREKTSGDDLRLAYGDKYYVASRGKINLGAYNVVSGYQDKTYKIDTTVRDNVVKEDDTLGKILNNVFKENPTGSDNDIINETYKKVNEAYDISGWGEAEKEIAVDIPLNIIAVANDIERYKPGDLGIIEEADIVSEFERKLNILCKQASGWNSKVNNYFTRAEYQKKGYEEKYLQILGELAQSCCSAEKLKILREEIAKRKEEILENTLLARYAEKHPGLDHLAGVPKGGTFVLVYKDQKNSAGRASAMTSDLSAKESNQPISNTEAARDYKVLEEYVKAGITVPSANTTENRYIAVDEGSNDWEYVNKIADLYKEAVGLRKGITTEESNLPGFTVVADFYLPYLCCSDCPPMSFVLPKERVSLRLPVEFVCTGNENETILPFEVFPVDGIVDSDIAGEAIVAGEEGGYVFDVSKLPSEQYGKVISFTVNGQQTDATLIVYQEVQAAFDVPEENIKCYQDNGVAIVRFNNTTPIQPDAQLKYEWDFGDDTLTDERFVRDPVHQYNLREIQDIQPLKVTLKVTNGRCPSIAEKEISVCEITEDPCREKSISMIGQLGDKIEKYDRETFGNFINLYSTTVEIKNKVMENGTSVFEHEVQVEILQTLLQLNQETAAVIRQLGDDMKSAIPLANLYLDQVLLMLYMLNCNWTSDEMNEKTMGYFTSEVQGMISYMIEVIEGIRNDEFVNLLEAYLKDTFKLPDKFVEILNKILQMLKA